MGNAGAGTVAGDGQDILRVDKSSGTLFGMTGEVPLILTSEAALLAQPVGSAS